MNYVLPLLKDHGNLPGLEVGIEMDDRYYGNSFPIPAFKNLLVDRSNRQVNTSRYDLSSIFTTAVPLIESFYMTNQGYYICFGCGSIKDDNECMNGEIMNNVGESNEITKRECLGKSDSIVEIATRSCRSWSRSDVHSMKKRAVVTSVESTGQHAQNWCQKTPAREAGTKETIALVVRRTLYSPRHRVRLTLGSLGKSHEICTYPADHSIRAPHNCPVIASS